MQKLDAIGCVLGWSLFWAFGYLALSAGPEQGGQAAVAALLAAAGMLAGSFTYIRLGRDMPR
jgi:amino acid transporter